MTAHIIYREIKKQEIQKMSNVNTASMVKMGRCKNVTMDILLRNCEELDVQLSNILERVPNNNDVKNGRA